MFRFLDEMAIEMNFEVSKEDTTITRKRIDMTWKNLEKPGKTILIEHENQHVSVAIEEEVRKLANYRADLHVCITYVKAEEYPGKQYALETRARAPRVKNSIDSKEKSSFLDLIIL